MVRPLAAIFGAAALALVAVSPSAVRADDGIPSYASHEDTIHGRITEFDGQYNLKVRDDKGYVDSVHLHDGTIINPTGLRLASGLSVTILGHGNGNVFEANEIDTPYTVDPAPDAGPAYVEGYATPAYGYYGYGCCYGYGYGYDPYAIGFAFGFGGGYYGGYGRGGYYGHGGYYGRGGYGHGGYQYGHGYNPSSSDRRYLTGSRGYAGAGSAHYAAPRSSGGGASSRGSFSGGRSSGGGRR